MMIPVLQRFLRQAGNDATDTRKAPVPAWSPDTDYPLHQLLALWQTASAIQPSIGFRLHQFYEENETHYLQYLASSASCPRQAQQAFLQYAPLLSENDRFSAQVHPTHTTLRFYSLYPEYQHRGIVEHYFSGSARNLALRAPDGNAILGARFTYAKPENVEDYHLAFGRNLRFGAHETALDIANSVLDQPNPLHDPYLFRFLLSDLEARLKRRRGLMPPGLRVDIAVRELLHDAETPSASHVADRLGLTESQLLTQLRRDSINFRMLVDDSRRRLAQHLLAGPGTLADITAALGFSEPAALQHACLRWFGKSAGQYQREAQAPH